MLVYTMTNNDLYIQLEGVLLRNFIEKLGLELTKIPKALHKTPFLIFIKRLSLILHKIFIW